MKYFLQDDLYHNENQKNAGSKARVDIEQILKANYYQKLEVEMGKWTDLSRIKANLYKFKQLNKSISLLKMGDTLVIQFPILNYSLLFPLLLLKLKFKGIKVIILIHDLESLRASINESTSLRQKIIFKLQEDSLLRLSNKIVAHNSVMKTYLTSRGISTNKIVCLEIFDYLLTANMPNIKHSKNEPIVIAGNLSKEKSGYLYELPENIDFNLFGVGYNENNKKNHINYFGSFFPDDLPYHLKGSFGLVWDGPSSGKCIGVYGNYLKYNNSHKASLYLTSGLPLIVWEESALASFVIKYKIGFTVKSISDISERILEMSDDDYSKLTENVLKIGYKISKGYFLKKSLNI